MKYLESIVRKTGLVLSGGGGKGAYQVGIVRAIAELGITVDCVAGTSIGGLNGAIVAAAPSMKSAANQLSHLWCELTEDSPLEVDYSKVAGLIAYQALTSNRLASPISIALESSNKLILKERLIADEGVCKAEPMDDLFEKYLNLGNLYDGLPLYVALYEKGGSSFEEVCKVIGATLGITNTKASEFMRVQSFARHVVLDVLRATSALPIIFKSPEINGKHYADGGIGDWYHSGGNTPITPLIETEQCEIIIVSHLSNGIHWSANSRTRDAAIIEIRPQETIKGLLDFSGTSVSRLMEQGYEDGMRVLTKHIETIKRVANQNIARQARDGSLEPD